MHHILAARPLRMHALLMMAVERTLSPTEPSAWDRGDHAFMVRMRVLCGARAEVSWVRRQRWQTTITGPRSCDSATCLPSLLWMLSFKRCFGF